MEQKHLVITIDRQYGSGGRIVGKKLSEKLGIPFYDEEILKMASEESAVNENLFRLNDEKAGNNLLYRAIGGFKSSLQKPSIDDDVASPENLFRFQAVMIRKAAAEKSCIIMGRCADYVLEAEGLAGLIRLFVYSDIPTCIRRVMEVDGVDAKEALNRVNRISKQRRDYYKYYTGKDWEDMANYDLPINTTRIDLEDTIRLIESYIHIRELSIVK